MLTDISAFLETSFVSRLKDPYLICPIEHPSAGLLANVFYYDHPQWAEEYLKFVHRDEPFRSRWQAAIGDWNDKIVVDIGCGPGNVFATLKGKPNVIIGVDVAPRSLGLASAIGYVPVLADAAKLPFKSEFADFVILNATLHHCDDMEAVLKEAARLVKPGGLLIADQDPQLSAWNYKGLAKFLWNARLTIYKLIGKGFHKSGSQQYWGIASEIHHKPGHGVSTAFFKNILGSLGFNVDVYPHNLHDQEVLRGKKGWPSFKYILGNMLSGRNPISDESAITIMCRAVKRTN